MQGIANSNMSHFCFLWHQNLHINLQKGFNFWGLHPQTLYRASTAPCANPKYVIDYINASAVIFYKMRYINLHFYFTYFAMTVSK